MNIKNKKGQIIGIGGEETATKSRILCAAIHYDDNKKHAHQPINVKSGFVVAGHRHCNCIMTMAIFLEDDYTRDRVIEYNRMSVEGFLTSDNRFLNRKEACHEAIANGQVKASEVSGMLYSEDLY